jgi:hypothetical protein
MGLKVIPCLLYVDTHEDNVDEIVDKLDEGGWKFPDMAEHGAILPDFTREVYEVGEDKTPRDGPVAYKAKVDLKYMDPVKADPEVPAGTRELEIMARNSLEAAMRAFDQFHRENFITDSDSVEVNVQVTRVK